MAVASTEVLVERAQAQTGLDDLGPDGWQIGLAHLVDAVERDMGNESQMVGRIEAIIVERLVQRLRIEAWYACNAADADRPVENLLVIVGLPRTATTAVHHLLANDPQFRYLRSWEVTDPVPPPRAGHDDPRRPAEQPPIDVRHIVAVDGPAEDWPIHTFAFDHAELILPVPTYTAWWRTREHAALFSYHERLLRLLHSYQPPRHWLLKLPSYLFMLEELAAHYPLAQFVMTHRDPVAVIASACSTVAASRRKRIPTWTPEPDFGLQQLDHWQVAMTKALAARDTLGDHRFVDITQHELETDPIGTVQRIYAAAGLELAPTVAVDMAQWAMRNQRGTRGDHHYDLADYNLTPAQVTTAFDQYLTRNEHLGLA